MRGGEYLLLERVLRFFVVLLMAIVGGTLFELAVPTANDYFSAPLWHTELGIFGLTLAGLLCILTGTILGGIIGYPLAPFFTGRLKRFSVWVEGQLGKMPTRDVIAGAIGLFIGLIIALPLTTLIIAYWQKYVTKEMQAEKIEEKAAEKKR